MPLFYYLPLQENINKSNTCSFLYAFYEPLLIMDSLQLVTVWQTYKSSMIKNAIKMSMSILTKDLSEESKRLLFHDLVPFHFLDICRWRWLVQTVSPSVHCLAVLLTCKCCCTTYYSFLATCGKQKMYFGCIMTSPGRLSTFSNVTSWKSSSSTFFITNAKKTARPTTCSARHIVLILRNL